MTRRLAAFTMRDMEELMIAEFARKRGSKDKTRRRKRSLMDNVIGTTTAGRVARTIGTAAALGAGTYASGKYSGQIKGLAKSAYKKLTTRKPKTSFRQKEMFGPTDTRMGPWDTRVGSR